MSGLRTALQFLTVVPVSGGADLASAVRWGPLVGLFLGALLAAADLALAPWVGPAVRAVILVALLAALTGALHLDGLADSADGLLVHRSPADRLAIMRDPRTGGFGVVAVTLVVLAKVAALTELEGALRTPALLITPALARWTIVALARLLPDARVGLGSVWRAGSGGGAFVLATALALLPAVILAGLAGVVLAGAAALTAAGVGLFSRARIGGVTGDVLGATVELVEAACWIVASAL
ncbi:MAG: adenosylcobinamide-GDP ribazoletransferase [Chloroflexota bacterium]|nr:adenosylcobinamide-GDP ribazoletransferase [Dehalococcoidia bacterium]MDW8255028.1 adenosylcobinamide-GDP ribazoletransferase [Chloroflexota bacterium]